MPLTITCSCGAHLEIDDRFAGQVIPCPDCQASLHLPAPEPIRHPRVSGLAVAALLVALVGAFTVVGALAGIVLGALARRRIERQPETLAGLGLARAALLVGASGIILTLAGMLSPEVFHLDALLRELRWARRLDYSHLATVPAKLTMPLPGEREISLVVPSRRWGLWRPKGSDPSDPMILMDVWDDAQLACQSVDLTGDDLESWDSARTSGINRLLKSELLALLDPRHQAPASVTPRDIKQRDDGSQEMFVDFRAGCDRTFLLRMSKNQGRLFVLVGTTRKTRFAALQDEFRKALDSVQVKVKE